MEEEILNTGGRPKDPTALAKLKGTSHKTKREVAERAATEIYASEGEIVAPTSLKGDLKKAFKREAAYMQRVNDAAGEKIYGDTDIEALVMMVSCYGRYVEYRDCETEAVSLEKKQRYNSMKNKELAAYERYLRLLKLDPSSRVDFSGMYGGLGANDELADV